MKLVGLPLSRYDISAPEKPRIRVYDSEVPILLGVLSDTLARIFYCLARAGRSRIIDLASVVHASYTWFMDRGPYSDVPSDTRPMERSK